MSENKDNKCAHHDDLVKAIDRLTEGYAKSGEDRKGDEVQIKHLIERSNESHKLLMELKDCFNKCMREIVTKDTFESKMTNVDYRFGQVYKHSDERDRELRQKIEDDTFQLKAEVNSRLTNKEVMEKADKKNTLMVIGFMIAGLTVVIELIKWLVG